jgi:P-type Ca2+ transporter type 2C
MQAFLIENDKEHVDFVGNRTECALLMMLRKWEVSIRLAVLVYVLSRFLLHRALCALCSMQHASMLRVQMSYKDLRTKHEPRVANLYGFSSAKKMASVLVRTDNGFRLYNKVMRCPCPSPNLQVLALPPWVNPAA